MKSTTNGAKLKESKNVVLLEFAYVVNINTYFISFIAPDMFVSTVARRIKY